MAGVTIGLEEKGLGETIAAFFAYDALVRPEVHHTLREIGEETRDIARLIAESKALSGVGKYSDSRDPHPGALVAKVRVNTSDRRVSITEYSRSHSAKYPSYPYPRHYEYGKGGVRAFMHPAVDAEQPLLPSHFDAMVRRLRDLSGLEGGE